MKVSIIGAGQVGSTLAMRIVESDLADVVLVDIFRNLALGKSLDILDAAPLIGHERTVIGTDDYADIRGSQIVVITAGLPRKPGMSRDELSSKNCEVVKAVSGHIKAKAPDSIVIVVTNPLDAMTYLAYKTTAFKRYKVFGMAGELDGSRFKSIIANGLNVPRASVQTFILGSHGDTMVPILSNTSVNGKPILSLLPKSRIDELVGKTRARGAEIVSHLGTGSAYFSPSAAIFKMLRAVIKDTNETLTVSAYLDGEYGLKDIAIGVPCKLGRSGIEEIVELKLSEEEKNALAKSARAI